MAKVQEWEYDDTLHDYIKWQEELERLLKEDEPDEDEIQRIKNIISDYESVLFCD